MTELKLNIKQTAVEKNTVKDGWYTATYDSPFDRLIYVRTIYGHKEMFILGASDTIQHYENLQFILYKDWKPVEKITVGVE